MQNQSLRRVTRLGVYGILIRDQSILLIKKKKGGCYAELLDLPGGGVEFGEGPEETLRREIQEEVGMKFDIMHLVSNLSHQRDVVDIEDPYAFHHLGQIYRVEEYTEIKDAEPEEQFDWYGIQDISLSMLTPFAQFAVQHILKCQLRKLYAPQLSGNSSC